MIALQFPKLDKAVLKKKKDLQEDDPRNGIIVLDQHAIVFRNDFCLAINLLDYFVIDCNIEDSGEVAELEDILFYMDGKTFSPEYWAELTKGANTELNNGMITIENPKYSKDLHYKDLDVNMHDPLLQLIQLNKRTNNFIESVGIPYAPLKAILDVLPADLIGDVIVFDFAGQNFPIRFTFKGRKHFFGFIIPDYMAAVEQFRSDALENFVSSDVVKEVYNNSKSSIAPTPDSFEDAEDEDVVFDEAKPDLFGGNIRDHDESK